MKQCCSCEKVLEERDFYHDQFCYRCQYKIKKTIEHPSKKNLTCKICSKPIPEGNKVYCSTQCLYIGKLKHDKSYWFRKCTAPQANWKK